MTPTWNMPGSVNITYHHFSRILPGKIFLHDCISRCIPLEQSFLFVFVCLTRFSSILVERREAGPGWWDIPACLGPGLISRELPPGLTHNQNKGIDGMKSCRVCVEGPGSELGTIHGPSVCPAIAIVLIAGLEIKVKTLDLDNLQLVISSIIWSSGVNIPPRLVRVRRNWSQFSVRELIVFIVMIMVMMLLCSWWPALSGRSPLPVDIRSQDLKSTHRLTPHLAPAPHTTFSGAFIEMIPAVSWLLPGSC